MARSTPVARIQNRGRGSNPKRVVFYAYTYKHGTYYVYMFLALTIYDGQSMRQTKTEHIICVQILILGPWVRCFKSLVPFLEGSQREGSLHFPLWWFEASLVQGLSFRLVGVEK